MRTLRSKNSATNTSTTTSNSAPKEVKKQTTPASKRPQRSFRGNGHKVDIDKIYDSSQPNDKVNGHMNGHLNGHISDESIDDTQPSESADIELKNNNLNNYEINHAKDVDEEEEEEEEDDDEIDSDKSSLDDGDDDSTDEDVEDAHDIADQIEGMGDNLDDTFNSHKEDSDSILKSDLYFMAQSKKRKNKVSKHSFSSILENFDMHEAEIHSIIAKEHELFCKEFPDDKNESCSEKDFSKFYHLLKAKFNLLFYGYGSKRNVLKRFAEECFHEKHHYIVIHGYIESIKLKDVITILSKSMGYDTDSLVTNQTELLELMKEYYQDQPLFMLIHSIDVLYSKNVKIRNFLSNLCFSIPNVHILASVDHVNSPSLWSLTDIITYRWLWYKMTTYEPYLIERKYSSSQSSIFSTGSKSWKQSTNLQAVKQVYNSVNSNAQKIFLIILNLYLDTRGAKTTFAFYALYLTCREEFLVNSEVTLREHLAEFKYHSLIKITKASDGAESIQVTIDKDTAKRFMDSIESDND